MNRQFKIETLQDLKYWTSTILRCIETCLITGLIQPHKTCACGADMYIRQKSKARHKLDEGYCFFCEECKTDKSIRKDTVFERSSKTLSNWIDLIFTFSLDSDVTQGSKLASWERKRGSQRYKQFRKCCGKFLDENFEALGDDWIVEIDESAFNKKNKHNRGTSSNTRWVFGMVERRTGRCKFVYVPNRSRDTLLPIIQRYVGQGATVYSDMWRSYWVLGSAGYIHRMVNHANSFVDRDTAVHTNTIKGIWKWAKAKVQTKGGYNDEELQSKLDEFAFRKTYAKDAKTNFIACAKVIAAYWNVV